METTIQLLTTPVIVDIGEWLCKNIGYIAAGKRMPNSTNIQLLAIQKADTATEQMRSFAQKNDALIITSISEGEANAID